MVQIMSGHTLNINRFGYFIRRHIYELMRSSGIFDTTFT